MIDYLAVALEEQRASLIGSDWAAVAAAVRIPRDEPSAGRRLAAIQQASRGSLRTNDQVQSVGTPNLPMLTHGSKQPNRDQA